MEHFLIICTSSTQQFVFTYYEECWWINFFSQMLSSQLSEIASVCGASFLILVLDWCKCLLRRSRVAGWRDHAAEREHKKSIHCRWICLRRFSNFAFLRIPLVSWAGRVCPHILPLENFLMLIFTNYRDEKQHIKLPRDIDDAKNLGKVLYRYKDKYYFEVLTGVFVAYILYPFKAWKKNLWTC